MRLRYRKILYFNNEPQAAAYKAMYGPQVWYHKKKILPDGREACDFNYPVYWVFTEGGNEVEISGRYLSAVQAANA